MTSLIAFVFALSATVLYAKSLNVGNWDSNTRTQIQKLIDENANKGRYVVFDWDHTCIFADTEEALFRYMIENVLYKATPAEFSTALRAGVPDEAKALDGYKNKAGTTPTFADFAADIELDYEFIYTTYISQTSKDLASLQATNQYLDWRAKFSTVYDALFDNFDASVAYPWLTYFFVGMTPAEVSAVTEASNDKAMSETIGKDTWTSPEALPGQAGVISGSFKRGLRIQTEMSDLMATFRANGIDVYVCSASHETVVRVFAGLAKYGYNVPDANVIAMKTKIDSEGKYLPVYDDSGGYPQTQGPGKVTAINQTLVTKYNGEGPIFIASDSAGDYYMATEYEDTQLTLMINRLYANDYGKLGLGACESLRTNTPPRYVLQGRDENKGQFRPSIATVKMGESKEKIFNAEIDPGHDCSVIPNGAARPLLAISNALVLCLLFCLFF